MSQTSKKPRLLALPHFNEARGELTALEFENTLPFRARRLFLVHGVPPGSSRGAHAHKLCDQFLICTAGAVTVEFDNGTEKDSILLNRRNVGLFLPSLVWARQTYLEPNSSLLVLASHEYDPADYIHGYEEYIEICEGLGIIGPLVRR